MGSQAQSKASTKYNKSRDNIMLRPTKEDGQQIRQAAAAAGVTVQRFILDAVRDRMPPEAAPGKNVSACD